MQWLDVVNRETLRLVCQYRVHAWIADNRLLRAIRTKDSEWMDNHIMQPLNQLKVFRLAVISSLDGMNQLIIKLLLPPSYSQHQHYYSDIHFSLRSAYLGYPPVLIALSSLLLLLMQTLLSFPFLTVYLHTGPFSALETHWHSFATSAEFRSSVAQAVQLGLRHQVKGWIADDRQLGAVRPRDLDWVYNDVLLPLDQAGLQRFALLESQDTLNRLTIAKVYTRVLPAVAFEVHTFQDIALARAWAKGSD